MKILLFIISIWILVSCSSNRSNEQGSDTDTAVSKKEQIEKDTLLVREDKKDTKKMIPCRREDSLALLALYNSTGGESWKTTWDLGKPVCTWHGITLSDKGNVKSINLNNNGLRGKIPDDLSKMYEVGSFSLEGNNVQGIIYIPKNRHISYYSENDIDHVLYMYNETESHFDEPQLNKKNAYVFAQNGLKIYNSPEINEDNVIGIFDPGENLLLKDDLINNQKGDNLDINGFIGRMVPVGLEEETGYVFSGYLSSLPFTKTGVLKKFLESFHLESDIFSQDGYANPGDEYTKFEEYSGSSHRYFFESGIRVEESSYYEGGETDVCLPRQIFTLQEAYLFADALFNGEFSEQLGSSFPDKPVKETEKDNEVYKEVTVKFTDGQIREISVEYAEPGYVETKSLYVEDEYYIISGGGGS